MPDPFMASVTLLFVALVAVEFGRSLCELAACYCHDEPRE